MYVRIVQSEDNQQDILVYGEKLARNEADGCYLLPGRYVSSLRVDDLPAEVRFQLDGCLVSGLRFYPEDQVLFGRGSSSHHLQVYVTTRYLTNQWDGMFSLLGTMENRKQVIQESQLYTLTHFQSGAEQVELGFTFWAKLKEEQDLESALEQVCDQVRWIEEQGNQQIVSRSLRWLDHLEN